MAEKFYGTTREIFDGLKNIDPNQSLQNLRVMWSIKPAAIAAVFIPGHEQRVIDFLIKGLPEY